MAVMDKRFSSVKNVFIERFLVLTMRFSRISLWDLNSFHCKKPDFQQIAPSFKSHKNKKSSQIFIFMNFKISISVHNWLFRKLISFLISPLKEAFLSKKIWVRKIGFKCLCLIYSNYSFPIKFLWQFFLFLKN